MQSDPFEALATPVAQLDAKGCVSACNPAFASWLGVSARRLQGLSLSELDVEAGRREVDGEGRAVGEEAALHHGGSVSSVGNIGRAVGLPALESFARNAVTGMMRGMGYGKGYAYDHDAEGGFSASDYWPEEMPAPGLPWMVTARRLL